ncbi:hypothetical protein [uncultured Dubosiella sp.]|uniref:hypothetical protein n=1 Tax=uncultured Dubosiella sp. TaxID=1937011 RepID=UPI00259713FB|nr:hypothetical protein [uncultured Dubosiella sp.]
MKTIKRAVIGLVCVAFLAGCASAESADVTETMMDALKNVEATSSYSMRTTYEKPEGVRFLEMVWKTPEAQYEYVRSEKKNQMPADSLRQRTKDQIKKMGGILAYGVFEVKSVQTYPVHDAKQDPYTESLEFYLKRPMRLDDEARCIGLKSEFAWEQDGSKVKASLRKSAMPQFNKLLLEEQQRSNESMTDYDMSRCDFTFWLDDEGRFQKIEADIELKVKYEGYVDWIDRSEKYTVDVSYDDVPEAFKQNTQKAFEHDLVVGDTIEWPKEDTIEWKE